MIQHQGVWLPDGETHLVDWMNKAGEIVDGKGTYQIKKLRAALEYVKQWRTAIDVGAHCGLWSMQLAKQFNRLHAFEPVAAHRDCWKANLEALMTSPTRLRLAEIDIHACALGDHEDSIKITTAPTSSGDSRVDGSGEIPMHTLDSFGFVDVDFIKIDCEGYELFVVKGAEETIKRCRPTMIVEQKGHGTQFYGFRKEEAVELLESWGMRRVLNLSGDVIMVWPEK